MTLCAEASTVPDSSGPTTIGTCSAFTSLLAASTAVCGAPWVSATTVASCLPPRMPPCAFTWSTTSFAASSIGGTKLATGPVTSNSLATWCTFVPCFLWIGLGAPFIERLRDNRPLNGALAGITAAVVGVILNLAIWFALHTWFHEVRHLRGFGLSFDMPGLSSIDPWAVVLSVAAMVAIFRFKAGMIQTLLACSAAGIVLYLAGAIG